MTQDLVIIGCGGFGREVADVVDSINQIEPTWNLLGFLDDHPSPENLARVARRGSQVLGTLDHLALGSPSNFVVGIGECSARSHIANEAQLMGWNAATLKHPTAAIGANAVIGDGTVVCAHVAIGSDVTIGRHVHLDRNVQIGHDSSLGDYTTAHPSAVVSGSCFVEYGVELGTNCTLLPSLTVGHRATVGAGAVVTKTVLAQNTVAGVPAKVR